SCAPGQTQTSRGRTGSQCEASCDSSGAAFLFLLVSEVCGRSLVFAGQFGDQVDRRAKVGEGNADRQDSRGAANVGRGAVFVEQRVRGGLTSVFVVTASSRRSGRRSWRRSASGRRGYTGTNAAS